MTVLTIILCFVISTEVFVRRVDPPEVGGWDERPSLEPHPTYGYRLKPNKITRLRRLSYDYTVEANALGFPGPLYYKKKPDLVYRAMITGDAFESTEGVDTSDAWPKLLEEKKTSVLFIYLNAIWKSVRYISLFDTQQNSIV